MFHGSLVLEGGGMRGVYTAGVLDFFQENGLYPEAVYGVSAGAVQGCSYLSRQKGRGYACAVNYLDDWRYMSIRMLLLTGNLFGVKMCYDTIPNKLYPFDLDAFQANPSKLYAVMADVQTGEPVYRLIDDMDMGLTAIRASASLPLVSRMVKVDGRWMLDGGIADSIPLARSVHDGFEKNIVILTQHKEYRKKPSSSAATLARLRYPFKRAFRSAMLTRSERYNAQLELVHKLEAEGRAFVIQPQKPVGFARIEKDRGKLEGLYRQGYADAERLWPELTAYVGDGGDVQGRCP